MIKATFVGVRFRIFFCSLNCPAAVVVKFSFHISHVGSLMECSV